jgi:sensor histidine kinase YesM
MNTLNNIHSLIDIDTDEAKESIIRLSKLMRHLLYDSEIEKIPIQKEFDFIKNYIDLMKMRYSDKVAIGFQLPEQVPNKSIPPLLFTSFVENAFKHGVSYKQDSFINIEFSYNGENLTFQVKNSILNNGKDELASGIGIENARKRLDLLYGEKYSLEIDESDNEYYVRLSIPV